MKTAEKHVEHQPDTRSVLRLDVRHGLRRRRSAAASPPSPISLLDEERRRLARDLHDGVQQQLVVLRMRLQLTRWTLPEDPFRAQEIWSQLEAEVEGIIEHLREVSRGIYPSILADRGLTAALHGLASRVPLRIKLVTDPDPLPRLDPRLESGVYFLVQEAVTNALKHGGAGRLVIDVRAREGRLEVDVSDDGRGFDPSAIGEAGGLRNMRERAAALGGSLLISSAPGAGARIRAAFPLSEDKVLLGSGSPRSRRSQGSRTSRPASPGGQSRIADPVRVPAGA